MYLGWDLSESGTHNNSKKALGFLLNRESMTVGGEGRASMGKGLKQELI